MAWGVKTKTGTMQGNRISLLSVHCTFKNTSLPWSKESPGAVIDTFSTPPGALHLAGSSNAIALDKVLARLPSSPIWL
jgi:hypothetical protein